VTQRKRQIASPDRLAIFDEVAVNISCRRVLHPKIRSSSRRGNPNIAKSGVVNAAL
jgi:hypothetical protein